jgi:drug/metabolite transporter (DMT)-like permease
MNTKNKATLFAILAAALYAINIPLSKLLLGQVSPTRMASFLYLGAGVGLFLYGLAANEKEKAAPLTRAELPYTAGMIVLDIAAPIFLMLGLKLTGSANASLLNNFEIVATALLARDTISLQHTHEHSHRHTHEHSPDGTAHTHE